ncbi:MAG: hypothetical protein WCN87_00640 [Chlamydiota bacterium]
MSNPVSRSTASDPSLQLAPLGELPKSLMRLTSQKSAAIAAVFFARKSDKSAFTSFKGALNHKVTDVTIKTHAVVIKPIEEIGKIAGDVFKHNREADTVFLIDGGLLSIISLLRRGSSLQGAVKEFSQSSKFMDWKDWLSSLSEGLFKLYLVLQTALSFIVKSLKFANVLAVFQKAIIGLCIAAFSLITSFILGLKALLSVLKIDRTRGDIIQKLKDAKTPEARANIALGYCKEREGTIDADNNLRSKGLPSFLQKDAKAVQHFMATRKKWAMTGLFGSGSYEGPFQDFKICMKNIQEINENLTQIPSGNPVAVWHKVFLQKRKTALIDEANIWVDQLLVSLNKERAQLIISVVTEGLMIAVSAMVLAGLTAGTAGLAPLIVGILAAVLALCNSIWQLWTPSVTHEEKEHAIALITAHFASSMKEAPDAKTKNDLASLFNFEIPPEYISHNKLLAKQFEEHIKGILHQKNVQQLIDKKFVSMIKKQIFSPKKIGISYEQPQEFEKKISLFFNQVHSCSSAVITQQLTTIVRPPEKSS